jgi:coproporphyrinogen III oxidase-like Fe-S oxidoreductase
VDSRSGNSEAAGAAEGETLAAAIVERRVRAAVAGFFHRRRSASRPAVPACTDAEPRALYVHVPFCESVCPFCPFNSAAFTQEIGARYFAALREEMVRYGDLGYRFDVLHVGGGTPTILPSETARIVSIARRLWPVREVSVETNPNHLTGDILGTLRDAGVQRLSVGAQSFDDGLLARLGRLEAYGSGSRIRGALQTAAGCGIILNVDLMFDQPGQTIEMLERDVAVVRGLPVDQATFYPYMSRGGRDPSLPSVARQFTTIVDGLAGAFHPTTVWSFSRRTAIVDEYIAVRDEFAGLGAGAFGLLQGRMLTNAFAIPRYLQTLEAGRLPVVAERGFSRRDRMRYLLLMRLFRGSVRLEDLRRRRAPWELSLLHRLGMVRASSDGYVITERGRSAAVTGMRAFFSAVDEWRTACRDLVPGERW